MAPWRIDNQCKPMVSKLLCNNLQLMGPNIHNYQYGPLSTKCKTGWETCIANMDMDILVKKVPMHKHPRLYNIYTV